MGDVRTSFAYNGPGGGARPTGVTTKADFKKLVAWQQEKMGEMFAEIEKLKNAKTYIAEREAAMAATHAELISLRVQLEHRNKSDRRIVSEALDTMLNEPDMKISRKSLGRLRDELVEGNY